jgi:hypothetical protein
MAWSTAISGLRDAEFEMAKVAARQLLLLRHVGEPSS